MIDLIMVFQFATPLILASLGELFLEKSGVLNLGIEGSMLVGAYAGTMACLATKNPWLGLAVGSAAGLFLTLGVVAMALCWLADQVVAGTAGTLFALGLTSVLFRNRFGQSGSLLTVEKIPAVQGVDGVMVLAVLLVALSVMYLRGTRPGLLLRTAGENPEAAEAARFSVRKIRFGAGVFAGALAGLAGAYLALGITGSFGEDMVAGRGFVAIAMVTFGRWKPGWTLLGCVLVGYLQALQFLFQAKGWHVPHQLLLALPYAAALLVLAIAGRSATAPAALGRPYRGMA